MAVTTITISINGVTNYNIIRLDLPDKIEERSKCSFTVDDASGTFSFKKGQRVTVTDALEGIKFSGEIQGVKRSRGSDDVGTRIYHDIECVDKFAILDAASSNEQYTNIYAGAIAVKQVKDLTYQGITASYAIDSDTTQADFRSGTHSGTIATNNIGEGNLELAPAGPSVTILENTTAAFGSGTLTGTTASSNVLAPTSFKAIKMRCTNTAAAIDKCYTYVKIWQPGSTFAVVATRYLFYTVWIDSASPEAKFGVDILFTDGTKLRDDFNTSTGKEASQNRLSPHPATDLNGYATEGKWYGRTFSLGWAAGKNIQQIMVVCEGDKPGVYTAWFGPIMYLNADFTLNQYFFQNTFNVNPPQQMQRSGFASTSVTVVDAYDCLNANRVSNAYNVSSAGISKKTFIAWKETLPANTALTVEYSLDNGNSYVECTNNAALPALPTGLSLASKTIRFRQTFTQAKGASPESKPLLSYLQLLVNPSYVATKTDVTYSATTTSEWNASTTHTNTQASNNILQLIGSQRYFDDNQTNNEIANITLYGGSASGPGLTTTCQHYIEAKCYRLFVFNNLEARGRMDFAGTFADGVLEFDVDVDNTNMGVGCVYRTTNWSNYDNRHAYVVEVQGTTLRFGRGSNTGDGSAGTFTSISSVTIPFASQMSHRYRVEFTGSSHKIYIDDILYVNATDGTFTAAGHVGFRIRNFDASNGYIGRYDNFGVVKSLSGNWLGTSTSIAGAGTYLNSVVSWDEVSLDQENTSVLVESTINGGSSYQPVTNGGAIANLTAGQSLSGISVRFRITLTTSTATSMPQVRYFKAIVLGSFSSTGTRISSALPLSPVGICGSAFVAWNALAPSGTTVTVATSLNGSSYTNITNGGSISGISGQPAPTIDSFNLLTSGDYLSTARTGGTATTFVWDTTNSRLTVSGGTNALLLYTAISKAAIDVIIDIDQADAAGIVWRRTDNSNFYGLEVFDASSSAGATNVMRLYKVVANVKTQIGADISISFKRTTKRRIRVKMVSTAIEVYFDGVNVRSTSDASLSSPGLSGLINATGSARFYNLRIQPIGDNLSGMKVYTRVTLTSTDPLLTPQMTDLTTLVTNPNIGAGALIPSADYRNTYKSDNISDVAKQSDYYHNVKPNGEFFFNARQTVPAPWILTSDSGDILAGTLDVEDRGELYRNRQTIKGAIATLTIVESKTGDGSATSWALQNDVVSVSSIVQNGQSKTFGLKGIDTGRDFYYEVGSNSIAQDSSGVVLQKDIDVFIITYVGQREASVTRDNTGQFPNTVSQEEYIEQSGIDVPAVTILNQTSAAWTSSNFTDDLDVDLIRHIALDINITARSGTSPTIQFFIERKAADGTYSTIWQSSLINGTPPITVNTTIGPSFTFPESLGGTIRLRWAIAGTSPSWTFSASITSTIDAELAGIGVVEAIEDGNGMSTEAAIVLADSRLQRYGVQGKVISFATRRTGLAAGQYLPVFIPEHGLNDAAMLITSADLTTDAIRDPSGAMTQDYIYTISASEGAVLSSWSKALNDSVKAG